jgi:hypothetical protein
MHDPFGYSPDEVIGGRFDPTIIAFNEFLRSSTNDTDVVVYPVENSEEEWKKLSIKSDLQTYKDRVSIIAWNRIIAQTPGERNVSSDISEHGKHKSTS